MSKRMTNKQQNAVASQPAAKKDISPSDTRQTEEEHWVQDALEDDEVREALKTRHARGESR